MASHANTAARMTCASPGMTGNGGNTHNTHTHTYNPVNGTTGPNALGNNPEALLFIQAIGDPSAEKLAALTLNESNFLLDMQGKVHLYGSNLVVTTRQLNHLRGIWEKLTETGLI